MEKWLIDFLSLDWSERVFVNLLSCGLDLSLDSIKIINILLFLTVSIAIWF